MSLFLWHHDVHQLFHFNDQHLFPMQRRHFLTSLLVALSAPLAWLKAQGPAKPLSNARLEHWKRTRRIPVVDYPTDSVLPREQNKAATIRRILQAIETGACLSFAYHGGSTPGRRRKVSPASLFRVQDYGDVIYLTGYCHTRHANRTFRLGRIHEMDVCSGQ